MSSLNLEKLQEYISSLFGSKARLISLAELGGIKERIARLHGELKGFGYGKPYLVEFEVDGKKNGFILETLRQDSFGHDYMADRAQNIILAHSSYNKLPRHARSIDLGVFTEDGSLKSLGNAREFFIVVEKIEGREYHCDLEEISQRRSLKPLDISRCKALSDYLAEIHSEKKSSPALYKRRIRDLIGHGECIMGLIDNYPSNSDFTSLEELSQIERKCVDWRWKVRNKTHRLCQVHGDFHPWNVLFQKEESFITLDRSRGELGEAADDISSMTINYILFSIQTYGELAGSFEDLFQIFIKNYLEKTNDEELLTVIQPFYAWRGLVVANPVWYPTLSREARRKLLNFVNNILDVEKVDLNQINSYLYR